MIMDVDDIAELIKLATNDEDGELSASHLKRLTDEQVDALLANIIGQQRDDVSSVDNDTTESDTQPRVPRELLAYYVQYRVVEDINMLMLSSDVTVPYGGEFEPVSVASKAKTPELFKPVQNLTHMDTRQRVAVSALVNGEKVTNYERNDN